MGKVCKALRNIQQKAEKAGVEQERANTIVRIYTKRYSMEQISALLDIEMEQIQNILKDKGCIQYV